MTYRPFASRSGVTFAAAAIAFASGAVLAQTSTKTSEEAGVVVNSTATHYRLTNQNNVETISYDQARDLRVCNMTGRLAPAGESQNSSDHLRPTPLTDRPVPLHSTPTPVALTVRYDGRSHELSPGSCDRFRAKDVRLSSAQLLPMGSALDVSVEQMGARTAQAGHGGGHEASNADSTKELVNQLEQQDKTMRQANKELEQSQTRLAEATRKLKETQSAERRATSAERQAASGEQQEGNSIQQNASNGRQGTPE